MVAHGDGAGDTQAGIETHDSAFLGDRRPELAIFPVEKKNADAILRTELLAFEQEGLRFDQLEEVKEYRLFIVVKLSLVDAKTGDLIWTEPNFTGDNEYYVTDVTSIGEQKAAVEAVNRLAYRR